MSTTLAMRAGIGTLVLLFGVSALALGAKKEDPDAAGELYGDLYVIERNENGEPVTRQVSYTDPETGGEVIVECLQPIAFPSETCTELAECEHVPLNAEKGELFDPEEEDACEPQEIYADCLREVSFGRGSVARAQDFVIDSAYAEFIKTINEASAVNFDPAGRITLTVPAEDSPETVVEKTIDAPLENLGLYREIVTNGCLGTVTDEVMGEEGVPVLVTFALNENAIGLLCGPDGYDGMCTASRTGPLLCDYPNFGIDDDWWVTPTTPDAAGVTDEDLLLATAFLAGATDKSNPLSLDEIINLNTYLGLNTYTWVRQKKDRILTVSYFDFGAFTYDRTSVFAPGTSCNLLRSTDSTSFVSGSVDVFGTTPPGVNLDVVSLTVCRYGLPQGVCDGLSDPVVCGGANYFAQAAEHARKTIWFIHNWEVPEIGY